MTQRYRHSEIGLTDSGADQLTLHLGWVPDRRFRTHRVRQLGTPGQRSVRLQLPVAAATRPVI